MNRYKAREQAFIIIFQKNFTKDTDTAEMFDFGVSVGIFKKDEFSENIISILGENQEKIDSLIEENSIGWPIGRLPKVSLAILRLAVCEILYIEDIPIGVSINEAVELAKKYATVEDASYINGVLGTIAKTKEL